MARAETVEAWTAAERDLPIEFVVNHAENAGVIYAPPAWLTTLIDS